MDKDMVDIINILRKNGVKSANEFLQIVLDYGREKELLKENARLKNAIKNLYEMSIKDPKQPRG